MKQKIEWYQEVLDLEPGSKVFFPLARMQAEDGQPDAALSTLRHGLGRNPEHIEARLLLIDILFNQSKIEDIWPEVDAVSLMLGGYPGFWAAWTERMAKNPQSRDAALALNFLSASLKGEPISWSAVIEHGLGSILSGKLKPAEPALPVLHGAAAPRASAAAYKPAPAVSVGESNDEVDAESEDDDEQFSLKTRSMAEVLAGQGDYVGALDIYEELLRSAKTEDEKVSLEDAIARLSADIGMAASAGPEALPEEKAPSAQGPNRLVDVLELLAERLEAKS